MAGVIKADTRGDLSRDIQRVTFNFEDMSGQAGVYLSQVRREAEAILGEAKKKADQLCQQAVEQGRRDAVEAAQQSLRGEIDQRLKTLTPALQQAAAAVLQSKEQWRSHWETNVIQLALAIAQRIVRREVASKPQITLDWIREALELASGGGRLRVLLNPTDFETLGNSAQQIAASVRGLSDVEVAADPAVSPGGCIVTTEFGAIDQQIESQLARIEDELT